MVAKLGGELNLKQALESGDVVRVTELLDCYSPECFSFLMPKTNDINETNIAWWVYLKIKM